MTSVTCALSRLKSPVSRQTGTSMFIGGSTPAESTYSSAFPACPALQNVTEQVVGIVTSR